MAYELLEAAFADIDEIAKVFLESWAKEWLFTHFMPKVPFEEQQAWWAADFKNGYGTRGNKFFKITDTSTGRIVAFCRWIYPYSEAEASEEKVVEHALPEGSDVTLITDFLTHLDSRHAEQIDHEKMFYCYIIGTHPSYMRQGLATQLLTHTLKYADSVGAQVLLDATPMGRPLYRRLGWKELDKWSRPMWETYNRPQEYVWTTMVKDPNSPMN